MLLKSAYVPKLVIMSATVRRSGRYGGIVKINAFGTAQKTRK